MIEFYLIKFHPELSERNWLKIWDETNSHFIKIIINPLNNKWSLYYDTKHLNDYSIVLLPDNINDDLNSVKSFYIKLNCFKKTCSLHLPRQNIINFNFNLGNIRVEHTLWLSLLIFNNYTNTYINTSIIDSIRNNIVFDSKIIDTEINDINKSVDIDSQNKINNTIKKLIKTGLDINNLTNKKIDDKKINSIKIEKNTEPTRYITIDIKCNKKKLSFCITCMKRFNQIQYTLPQNLKDNIPFSDEIEFVLVDFGTDGLYNWIHKHFKWALKIGYLRYFKTTNLKHWHASVAKNTVHRIAKGDILVNLDCDNYTGTLGAIFILKIFRKYKDNIILHQWSRTSKDGTYGRLSYRRKNFLHLGGYDQSFYPMGYQDHDLIMRFKLAYGSNKYILASSPNHYSKAIENDKTKSLINTKYIDKISWKDMNSYNKQKSDNNIKNRRYIVNDMLDNIGIII